MIYSPSWLSHQCGLDIGRMYAMCAQLVGVLVCAEMNVHRDIMFHMPLIISVTIYYSF
jgi:hypothetical protein